jgi:hypothetical protein
LANNDSGMKLISTAGTTIGPEIFINPIKTIKGTISKLSIKKDFL